MNDQHQFSPNRIITKWRGKVMWIIEMINWGRIRWSFVKFSQPIILANVWKWVCRILILILGLKGLRWKGHWTIPTPQQKSQPTVVSATPGNSLEARVEKRREGSCFAKYFNLPSGEHVNKLRICVPGAFYIILGTKKQNKNLNKTEPYQCTVSFWAGRM